MTDLSPTPLFISRQSGDAPNVQFKMDCYQATGSFKLRGMHHLVNHHQAQGKTHYVASSGGNAGYSLACAVRNVGGKCTVVVPESTGDRMRQLIRNAGAELLVFGKVWNDADARARALCADNESVYVSPFDDPLLWAGHSTMVDEWVDQCAVTGQDFPSKLVVSVGGGGLLAGLIDGLLRHDLLVTTKIVAAETLGAASFRLAMEEGPEAALGSIDSVATSLGARSIARGAYERALKANIQHHLMSDEVAVAACRRFLNEFNVLVEPACGAALSYVYQPGFRESGVGVVVCGGVSWGREELENYS